MMIMIMIMITRNLSHKSWRLQKQLIRQALTEEPLAKQIWLRKAKEILEVKWQVIEKPGILVEQAGYRVLGARKTISEAI